MKNKERIEILESEISRLKVANRTTNERLELIEAKLGIEPPKPPCSAITDALQEMGNLMVMVERRKVKPEAPECEANNGVSDNPIKPDFIPDWKDAPEDAVCVAMDKDGRWYWYDRKPNANTDTFMGALKGAGRATNAHLLPEDYWKSTLMMRPEAVEPDYSHLLPEGYEFCFEHDAEDWVKVKMEANISTKEQAGIGHIMTARSFNLHLKPYYRPIRKTNPDYTHLLPEGYEFCEEADAEKWVKVEMMPESILSTCKQYKVGQTLNTSKCCEAFKPYYRPIRPIQYKVTTHEITTAIPDPYMPDWTKAPEGTVAHAWDGDGDGRGFWIYRNNGQHKFCNSRLTLPPDLDWKQSLRVKPN